MIKVYISGPMTGRPNNNIEAFNHAEDVLAAAGVQPLNPAHIVLHEEATWEDYMRHCIRMLSTADEMLLLPEWWNSKGALLEYAIAEELNIPIHKLTWWQCKAGMSARPAGGAQ